MPRTQHPLQNEKVNVLFTVWHLYQSGVTEPARIAALIGKKVHPNTVYSALESIDALLAGPFPLAESVRCPKCGANINQVPCLSCRVRNYQPGGATKQVHYAPENG